MKIWFTSDHHFNHKNIIGFCGRPYPFIHEMNRDLMIRWNSVVRDIDTVYHLGDLSYFRDKGTADVLRGLNGKIRLVPGNHDTPGRFGEVSRSIIEVLPPIHTIKEDGVKIVLCHYPLESWESMSRGTLHFHGHSHGKSRTVRNRLDVGVDCWDYFPVDLEAAIKQARGDYDQPSISDKV
jgi:calcineurin-like phosphoesterase family protein